MSNWKTELPGKVRAGKGDLPAILNSLTDAVRELRDHVEKLEGAGVDEAAAAIDALEQSTAAAATKVGKPDEGSR